MQGDNRETLKTIADNSIDAIVTDPPYGIDFLGKEWDANTGALETYQECLRVLKPGGHILAFSAARTYHHLAITLEQAGFEIRDQIMWIYSSGFPKSQDVGKSIQRSLGVKETKLNKSMRKNLFDNTLAESQGKNRIATSDYNDVQETVCTDEAAKQWAGWGTALKPAHEPIVMARKPIKTSIAKNVQKYGTGALNIDVSRVPFEGEKPKSAIFKNGISYRQHTEELYEKEIDHTTERIQEYNDKGRFPSNVIGEIPDYQKYFYCPKVSRKERHVGFDDLPKTSGHNNIKNSAMENLASITNREDKGNNHPTVKPVELMKYLIKLVTPPNGTVLDPFNGSGSTGMAAVGLGYKYIGCELDPNYVAISEKRIEAWTKKDSPNNTFDTLFDDTETD